MAALDRETNGPEAATPADDLEVFRFAVESGAVPVLSVGPEGRIEYANRAARLLAGGGEEVPLAGRTVRELDPSLEGERWAGHWSELRARGEASLVVAIAAHGARPEAFLDVRASLLVRDGRERAVWQALDVTALRRAEQALQRRAEDLATVLSTATDGFLIVDDDMRIVDANDAWCRLFGYSREEMPGLPITAIDADEDRAAVLERGRRIRSEGFLRFETRLRTRDGRVREVEVSSSVAPSRELVYSFVRDITERKQSAELVRRSLERLSAHVDHTPLAYIEWNERLEVVEWNAAAERIFGFTRAQVTGRHAFDLIVAPSGRAAVQAAWQTLLDGAGSVRGATDNVRADGRSIRCEWYTTPLRDRAGRVIGVASLAEDVTERNEALEALRLREDVLRSTIESMDDLVFVLDAERRFADFYQARRADSMYRPPPLFAGRRIDEVGLPADVVAAFQRALDALEGSDAPQAVDYELPDAGGARHYGARVTRRKDAQGRYAGAVAVVRDVTEQVRAEQGRRRLEAQMQQAQKLESLGVLAGGIAHDFNNLLTVVLGHADLALGEADPEAPSREHLEIIEQTARQAAELCRQLLVYAGKSQIAPRRLDLGRLVRDMAHMLEVSVSKKAALRYELAGDLPPVQGDAAQLRQVVMNLIINAAEAVGDGTGAIVVRTGQVSCSAEELRQPWLEDERPAGTYVFLDVRDTGCGMTPDTVARIFEPFFTTKFTGRGLGLAAALGIVRSHRGGIQVTSAPGEGTTFRILLPPAPRADAADAPAGVTTPWRGRGTVLLVDDEPAVRAIGRRMLERLGFQVLAAGDGEQALELLRQHGEAITLVALDLMMPRLDGYETLQQMRQVRPGLRALMMSGYGAHEMGERLGRTDGIVLLDKPFQFETLAAKLRELLGG